MHFYWFEQTFIRAFLAALFTLVALAGRASAQEAPGPAPSSPSATPSTTPSTTPSAPPVTPPAAPSTAPAETTDADSKKDAAREHFRRGVALFRSSAMEDALAEFLRSRELFPTKNATDNAAICLRQLGRFDEALTMVESLLADFPELSPEDRAAAEKTRAEVAERVGAIVLFGGEPGARVLIDGRDRGGWPLAGPIRVGTGTRVVRVYKPGRVPFETTVNIAGGVKRRIEVRLVPLVGAGELQVVEAKGESADVYVDGLLVGKTPWRGPIAAGTYSVALRGSWGSGTQPSPATVKSTETETITLTLENLPCELRIEPTPGGANVTLDGAPLPLGAWEGRVRAGEHRIDASLVGYNSAQERAELLPGARRTVRIELSPVLDLPGDKPQDTHGPFAEASAMAAFSGSLGGDLASSCASSSCEAGAALGGGASIRAGYRLRSAFELGLSIGYLGLRQELDERPSKRTSIDPELAAPLSVDDRLTLHGLMVGGFAGYTFGERWPLRARLGAGFAPAFVGDLRTASAVNAAYQSPSTFFFVVAPALSIGKQFDEHLEVMLGVEALFLLSLSSPAWDSQQDVAASGSIFRYRSETLLGTSFAFAPGLSARYSFH